MLKSSKIIILSIITLTILPCLVFGYHVLNLEISPDNYVFRRWSSVPQQFRVDSGPLGGVDGLPTVQSACNEWNNVPDTKISAQILSPELHLMWMNQLFHLLCKMI